MMRVKRKKSMRTIITFLIVVGNAIGACLTYLYFSNIAQIHQAQQNLPFYYTELFFGIGTAHPPLFFLRKL